jgi:hypothetical protein
LANRPVVGIFGLLGLLGYKVGTFNSKGIISTTKGTCSTTKRPKLKPRPTKGFLGKKEDLLKYKGAANTNLKRM